MIIKDYIFGFIEKIENTNISFWRATFLLYGIIFIRTFLENWANSLNLYHMSSFSDTFFHYPFFFFVVFLSSFIIATILTKEKISKISRLVALCSFGLITPPIIDLLVNKGGQIPYIFITGTYSELLKSFLTYFGGGDIGTGIRVELLIALVGFGFYIFYKTKNIKRVLAGVLLLYSTFFVFLASPSLIFGLQNAVTHQYPSMNKSSILSYYYHDDPLNSITSRRTLIAENNNLYSLSSQKIQNQYSATLAIIFIAISAILLFWCLFLYSPKKFWAVLKNFRYIRILHGSILISLGIYLAIVMTGRFPIGSLFDLASFISLFLAFLFAWLFAVWENDEEDIEIDRVSDPSRPLAGDENIFSLEEWRTLKYIFLTFSLCFAFLSGLYSFIFILLFIFVYHIYSTNPFRFKRYLGISSLLIAIISILLVWMGFFMAYGTENLNAFPAKYTWGILVIFFLVENAKNIKDISGDKKEGIKTLPAILGEKWGKLVVSLCLFFASLLVPVVFYLNLYTFLTGILFGLIFLFLTLKKNYTEKYLFFAYFAYVLVFFILINI